MADLHSLILPITSGGSTTQTEFSVDYILDNLASAYSASSTYAVGDYVIYNGDLYRCTTAITTAEAWTAAHWTAAKVGSELGEIVVDLQSLIRQITDWSDIQSIVRQGRGALFFPVGHQFAVQHELYGSIVFDVVGHDQVDSATGKTHTMTLLAHNCIANIQFDAEEAFYCADAAALPAGTYNFTVTSQPWYAGDVGKTFQFTTTVALPINGQLYIAMTYNQTLAGKSVKLYSSASSTTPLETVTLTEGSGGTSLGATDVALNHIQRMAFGSNNYKESAIRQFLNGGGAAGSYWLPQTKFDRPPSWMASLAGFKAGLPSDFLDAVDFAQVKCSTNNVYESPDSTTTKGGIYTVNDEFWLASRFEVYGSSDIVDGSKLMTYFVGAQNVDRIKLLSGAARYWWLRTPSSGHAHHVRTIRPDGSLDYYSASNSYGCVPACIIA